MQTVPINRARERNRDAKQCIVGMTPSAVGWVHTLCEVGELQWGGLQGAARRSRWAMMTTAVCRRSMASSLSWGSVR